MKAIEICEYEVPKWQQEESERRYKEMLANPETCVSWEDFFKDLETDWNKYKIIYSNHTKAEMKVAEVWYNSQAKGLGNRPINEVKLVSNSIILNPYYASIKYNETRIAFCKKFHYGIHYKIDEVNKVAYITSIFQQQQLPFWED